MTSCFSDLNKLLILTVSAASVCKVVLITPYGIILNKSCVRYLAYKAGLPKGWPSFFLSNLAESGQLISIL